MAWQLLHHKSVIGFSRMAFFLLIVTFLFPQFGGSGIEAQLWSLMSCSLQALFVILAVYVLEKGRFGEELLRWSEPGVDQETRIFRRRLNKRQPASDGQTPSVYRQVLAARNLEQKAGSNAESPSGMPMIPPVYIEQGTPSYSLHFAAADHPMAKSLRYALNAQSIQEVDSNAQIQIVILSEHFPRSKLQELLDSGCHVIPILISNISFEGDVVLERAASLQLIDYRDRSKSILTALAQTLKESPEENLPISFETHPQPLNSVVLPIQVPLMSLVVFNIGGWLIVSGLVSLLQISLVKTPAPVLNLAGSVCGFLFIKWGKDLMQRKTTNFRILPVVLISVWMIVPLELVPFIFITEMGITNAPSVWTITLSLLFSNSTVWTCLLCPGVLVVLGTAILWKRHVADWLPAFVSIPEEGKAFKPLANHQIKRIFWIALFLGTVNSFIPAVMHALARLLRP